jgi:hypothetical protein
MKDLARHSKTDQTHADHQTPREGQALRSPISLVLRHLRRPGISTRKTADKAETMMLAFFIVPPALVRAASEHGSNPGRRCVA